MPWPPSAPAAVRPNTGVNEIYIPVDDPRQEAEVRRFVEEVVGQLRRGSPFPVVATQFSQSQTALQGGDLDWVPLTQLDPEVAAVVERMPAGAISNPIRVAGGFQIVTLRGKREGGAEQRSTICRCARSSCPSTASSTRRTRPTSSAPRWSAPSGCPPACAPARRWSSSRAAPTARRTPGRCGWKG
jgi:hypothetical protein